VEVENFMYECLPYPYEAYCNQPTFDSSSLNEDARAEKLWNEAWSIVAACHKTGAPSRSPTQKPSSVSDSFALFISSSTRRLLIYVSCTLFDSD
jgi:hypothetical protein